MLEACEDRTVPTPVVTAAVLAHANEGDMMAMAVARLTRTETAGGLTVNYSLGGTASGGGTDYYTPVTPLTFLDGQATADVQFMLNNDSTSEATETIILTVTSGTGYTVGSSASATMNVYDNDAQVVSVSDADTASEGADTGHFMFFRTGDLSGTLTVNFSVGGTATSGTDYTSIGTTVTFNINSATAQKVVTALADNAVEGEETVTATVTSGTGYSVGSPSSGSVPINDDPPEIEVSATNTTEGGSAGAFTFTRSGGDVTSSLTVYYAASGDAISGDDYSALSGSVTFSANSSTANVTLTPVNDSDIEFDETVVAYVRVDSGYTIGEDDFATATVHDNETPIVTVLPNGSALEGGYNGEFWFMRQGDVSGSLTVNFTVSGTATSGSDYTSIGTSVMFAAGEEFATETIDAADESSSDPNETVIVTLGSGTGYTIGDDDTATVSIIDAATPFVTVEKIDNGTEGGTNGKFRFTRTGSTSGSLTAYYTVDGDATSGSDYTALTGSVTIGSGNSYADVTVTVTNDSDDEPGEYVSVEITANSNYAIGDSGAAAVSIDDNDLPVVEVTKIVDAAETGGYGIFRFSRTLGEVGATLVVSYSVGGSATGGTDYNSLSGTITFAVGEAIKDIVITPNTDGSGEGTETVSVTITSGSYTIGTASSASLNILEQSAGGVSGKFWKDTDLDGVIDGGETGVIGGLVFLMKDDAVVAQTITDGNGDYSFTGVTAGNYVVFFDMAGATPTVNDGTPPVTVTAGNTSSGVNEGCGAPPANTPDPAAGVPGFKWSTLTRVQKNTVGGVEGYDYTVEVQRGGKLTNMTVQLFMANEAATQPDNIKNGNRYILYNCHGYSMDITGVVDGQQKIFALFDPDSTHALFTTRGLYTGATAKEAKEALEKGKTVLYTWVGTTGSPAPYLHSARMKKIVLNAADNSLDLKNSTCDSKWVWDQEKVNTNLADVDALCQNPPKIGGVAQPKAIGFLFYIKNY